MADNEEQPQQEVAEKDTEEVTGEDAQVEDTNQKQSEEAGDASGQAVDNEANEDAQDEEETGEGQQVQEDAAELEEDTATQEEIEEQQEDDAAKTENETAENEDDVQESEEVEETEEITQALQEEQEETGEVIEEGELDDAQAEEADDDEMEITERAVEEEDAEETQAEELNTEQSEVNGEQEAEDENEEGDADDFADQEETEAVVEEGETSQEVQEEDAEEREDAEEQQDTEGEPTTEQAETAEDEGQGQQEGETTEGEVEAEVAEEQAAADAEEQAAADAEEEAVENAEAGDQEPEQTEEGEAQEKEAVEGAEEAQAAGDGDAQEEKRATPVEAENTQLSEEQTDLDANKNYDSPEAVEKEQQSAEAGAPPPAPHLPSPERSHTTIEGQMSTSALNVVWSFGLNRNVPVLNLSDGVRQAIMYPCAHVGIMYDFKNNKQHILQAHLNPITCTAASQDKRWLVTGDVGPDAMVNIWDTYTGTPIQTMFDPNPSGGVVAVALTPDSRYLATLSALPVQTLAIWDWTVDGDTPVCSADLKPEFGVQNFICFDHTDIHHVVTNSETQVLFYHWDDNMMKYFAPPLTDNDFNKPVGRYSQSLFQKGVARALTATSIGNLVVWDNNKPLSKFMDVNQSADKKPLKIIRIHDKGINVLTTTDSYIVVGDTAGHVKFFDQGLRLIYWYQDFHVGPCTAVSFAYMPDFVEVPYDGHKYPSDATKQAKPFLVRDFVVGTAIAVYGCINTDGSKFKVIHREHDAAVHALACHPKLPIVAMGSYSGLLKLWNYRTKEVVASRLFEKAPIHTCTFDPKGFCLAVGLANGTLYIVDSVALLDQLAEPYRYAQDCITHIAFSHNSTYFATADAGFAITVFKRQRREGRNPYLWHGRYRSHYKPIKDLSFGVDPDTNQPKLLSLGEDRMLIEYDLHYVGKTNNHTVPSAMDRIEQSAIPQCMTWYPPITKETFLLTANDQFKLKCYNSTTKMCRKTILGPTYGSPIKKMMVVPTSGDETKNRFLAYITDDKVGLHILPATGNPHLAMALIAHPSGVSNLACSFDGNYLFTAGGPDYAVHMWEINIKALKAQARLGGEDLIPFYGLLDGGRDGEMFAELEDLFYYAQLRHQGINSTETREIGNRIPISEVPYVMRAMGFYPSEQEIEDMLNEIKYEEYVNLGHYKEDIDLGSFIKLYVNHRPAFGLSADKLLWAFNTLADSPGASQDQQFIERGDLLVMLQKKGEHMTEYELAEHLTTLLGFNQEGGSCEQEVFEAEKAGMYIADNLPFDINAEILINEILGFSLTVDPPAADNTKDVIKFAADS